MKFRSKHSDFDDLSDFFLDHSVFVIPAMVGVETLIKQREFIFENILENSPETCSVNADNC